MGSHPKDSLVLLKLIVSGCALVAIILRLIFPAIEVDGVMLGLFVVGILPWLAPLVKSVELPGGLKLELQELREEVAQTRGTAESARSQAEVAVLQANRRDPVSDVAAAASIAASAQAQADWLETARQLVGDYNDLRKKMMPGNARTQRMTDVVGKMMIVARNNPGWSVAEGLKNSDRGWRLFSYAYAYVRPDFAHFAALVASACGLADDNKQFGQYWSLLALQRVLSVRGDATVAKAQRDLLEAFAWKIEPGTDRAAEIQRVLSLL